MTIATGLFEAIFRFFPNACRLKNVLIVEGTRRAQGRSNSRVGFASRSAMMRH